MISKIRIYQLVFVFEVLLYGRIALAEDTNFNRGFDQGIKTATDLQGKSSIALQGFQIERIINNDSSNPKEANYQANPDNIKSDAIASRNNDLIGKTITNGIDDRKSQFNYSIDPNSPEVQNIKKGVDDLYGVGTGQFSDCTKQTSCTTHYETHTCKESPKNIYQYCRKILTVDLVSHEINIDHYLTAHLSVRDHNYAGANVNAVTGKINFLGPHDASYRLDGRLPSGLDCHNLQGKTVSHRSNAKLDYMNYPSCSNGMTLDFHISDGHFIDITIDIVSRQIIYEPIDRWNDQCIGLANTSSCSFQEEHCVSAASTRDIQWTPVTRDCWEKQASYFCGASMNTNTCQPYRDQSCEQINSVCENKNDSGCTLYQETYRCPSKQCTDTGMICNGKTYCLTGDCVKQQKQADPDFQRSVSILAAVNEASKSYNANQSTQFPIFGGQVKTCNKDFLDFANCCSDSGWGVNLHLGQCDQEAKDLGSAKEKGLTTYIDSNDDCTLGLCSHKKRYCVFPSKLARIIQENGRRDQLHVLFGRFDNPDCRGLTPAELAQLDLSKINFSEIFSDISKTIQIEDQGKLNKRVNEKMQEWSKEKASHG